MRQLVLVLLAACNSIVIASSPGLCQTREFANIAEDIIFLYMIISTFSWFWRKAPIVLIMKYILLNNHTFKIIMHFWKFHNFFLCFSGSVFCSCTQQKNLPNLRIKRWRVTTKKRVQKGTQVAGVFVGFISCFYKLQDTDDRTDFQCQYGSLSWSNYNTQATCRLYQFKWRTNQTLLMGWLPL